MCNGAGLVVDTRKWLASFRDIHPETDSGDDVFLLHSFKRQGFSVAYATDPHCVVSTRPSAAFSAFWRQRVRWASKAPRYTDRDTLAVGGLVAITNIMWLISLAQPWAFLLFWLVKSVADYTFLRRLKMLYSGGYTLPLTLAINLIHPFYAVLTPIAGLFRKGNLPTRISSTDLH